MAIINPNLKHLTNAYHNKTRGVVLIGSSRSGKTWSIIDFIIWLCSKKETNATINIVRDVYNSFKTTLYDDFNRRLPMYGINSPFLDVKELPTFWLFGNKINLIGGDKPSKFLGAGCDYLIINEAIPNVDKKLFDQAEMRCRKMWIVDSNPSSSDHWALDLPKRDDVSYLKTTFQDNPFVSNNERNKILSYDPSNPINIQQGTADEWMWKVYGLGEEAEREGLILRKWKEGEFDESLPYVFGMDFGYVNDPTTLIKVAYDRKRNTLYCKELLYEKGLSTDDIADRLKKYCTPNDLIVADSAEPRLIDELYYKDFNIHKSFKGPDSVRLGLAKLSRMNIIVHSDSDNLKQECKNYVWNEKKSNTPIDEWNHAIDAIRYAMEEVVQDDQFFVG
jgi:PBSX family phage terminase large subunit